MASEIDPYRDWLGIKSAHRPPNHYELLDLKLYESDRERIENAEMIEMAKVLRHEHGPHAALAAQVGRELEEAVRCLLDPVDKQAYDAELFMTPRAPEPAAGPLQEHPVEVIAPAGKAGVDFSADLKLTDDEPQADELLSDALSAPAKATPSSAIAAPSKTLHRPPASEQQEPQRPSLMQLLDEQDDRAGNKDAKKKQKEQAKKPEKGAKTKPPPKPAPPRPKRKPKPSGEGLQLSLPEVSAKKLAIGVGIAAGVALIVGLGMLISKLPPGKSKVLAMIADADPQVRIRGLYALQKVEIDAPEAATLLLKVLREEKEDDVRIAAVNTLIDKGVSPSQSAEIVTLVGQEQNPTVKQLLQWLVPPR
jgi:hypothetical protein